jgi:diguanylate cyclase (GGDEF)-like protein
VPVRTFFLCAAGLAFVLISFLSWVVADRITGPIERLERGAFALSRGDLNVRIDAEAGDQVGRTTLAFNAMASQLQARIQDLATLNQGMEEFSSHLDLTEVATAAVRSLTTSCPGARVRILLADRDRQRVEVLGGTAGGTSKASPAAENFLGASGPATFRLPLQSDPAHAGMPVLADCRSVLVFPLLAGGRSLGCAVLAYDRCPPPDVNLDFLAALTRQTAIALENARLYRLAIEDPSTGAYVLAYFRRRLGEEVARARQAERPLSLLKLELPNVPDLAAAGGETQDRLMERLVGVVRGELRQLSLIGRSAALELEILLPETSRHEALRVIARLRDRLAGAWDQDHDLQVRVGLACFPEDALSVEFLVHEAELALRAGQDLGPATLPGKKGHDALLRKVAALEREGTVIRSPGMLELIESLERLAPSDLTVLLEGETGVGKEVLADLIHRDSRRAGPLVKVNCGALPPTLLESELFGHEKGAFTGAVARKPGRFELAQGGTIFLDEIGEASLDIQVRLLRVLQSREIERIGGTGPVKVDVRVLAATNRDLGRAIEEGRFREDLFYRLQGVRLRVPPLRERKQEIPVIAEKLRLQFIRDSGRGPKGFTAEALDALYRYDWPGNVRELRNVVSRALVLAAGDQVDVLDLAIPQASPEPAPPAPVVLARPAAPAAQPAPPASRPPAPAGGAEDRRPAEPPAGGTAEPAPGASGEEAPAARARQRAILELFERSGTLVTVDVVRLTGIPRRTCLRELGVLLEQGRLVRHGKRRAARYVLADPGRAPDDLANRPEPDQPG